MKNMKEEIPHQMQFFIDGEWVASSTGETLEVIDPATEEVFTRIAEGGQADVDAAVTAARAAFGAFSQTTTEERITLLKRIASGYEARSDVLARSITQEMGAPLNLSRTAQVASGLGHLRKMIDVLERFEFCADRGRTRVVKEPIGVCGLITPWNWPLNQIVSKVAPALAAGCTMVLKPSELAPLNAILFAEILQEAGVPRGVFNLVNGRGSNVGDPLARHLDVDMISFTGSTHTGSLIAKAAADTIKRVHQELGGKSANIILPCADLSAAVATGAASCFRNSGQSCNSPTRMFVPRERISEALAIAATVANRTRVGSPMSPETILGPLVSESQFRRVQNFVELGIAEGAPLVAGGLGKPEGLERGYYVRPTVFGPVNPDMVIAREEIFGPVLCVFPYENEEEVIRLANDSPYGLAAYVQGRDLERAYRVANRMRVGTIYVNYPPWDSGAPFGGYKKSGNGREYGEFGLESFLEVKGIVGHGIPVPSAH